MRGLRWWVGAVLAVGLWAAPASAPAGAQEACTNRVFEDAPRLGQYRQPIDQLATTLSTALGADVYVRVMGGVPNGDLDAWYQSMQAQCPAWQDETGLRKGNLVVLAVAADNRKTGLYYGADHVPALDPAWHRIQTEQMNPYFQRGEFGVGVLNGLSGIAKELAEHKAPPATERRPPVPPFQDQDGQDRWMVPPGEIDPPSTGPEADFPDFSWVIAIAVIGGLVTLAVKVMSAGGTGTGTVGGRRYSQVDPLERKYGWTGRRDSPISGHVPSPPSDTSSSSSSVSSPPSSSGGGGGGGSTSW